MLEVINPATGNIRKDFKYQDASHPHAATRHNGVEITYDANGNTRNDGLRTYDWDKANRLEKVTRDGIATLFVYHGDGSRVKKRTAGTVTLYPDAGSEISGDPANWAATVKYVRYPHPDVKLRIHQASVMPAQYLHRDHLASVRAVTSGNSGGTEEATRYRAFGQPLDEATNQAPTATSTTQKKYIGERWDIETGLMYLNFRYMDPDQGYRFISPDD